MAAATAQLLARLRRLVTLAPAPESDAELLTRYARHRDEDAFAALVGRHGPMVLRLGLRLLADPHAAEDTFQATFLILARRAGAIRRRQSVAAWLHGVAYRVALKASAARGRRREQGQGQTPDPADPHPDPLGQVTARELLVALEEEIQRLPEAYRLPVVLICLEGLSQEEAARRLGWTPGAVRGRLARGRQYLHARLAKRGVTLSAALGAAAVAPGAGAAVPASLSATAVKAATVFAAGKGVAAELVSANVAALGQEVLRAMCVKQFLAAGATAILLLGLLGAGTGLLFWAPAAMGWTAPGADRPPRVAGPDLGGAAGAPQAATKKAAAGQDAGSPDLLRAQRDRILIEEQKLTQVVDAALRKARSTARDDPEAALRLLRQTLLKVWDHPDVSERVRDALLTRLLAASREQRSAAAGPALPAAPFAWGQPHNGLRVGIAQEGPGRAGGARVALAVENVGQEDLILRLGAMRDTGKKQFPSALGLTLTDARGGVLILRRTFSRVAGRLDPFVVLLPAGGRYTLRYDLADLVDVDQDQAVVGTLWAPGRYRAAVEFIGKAVSRQESPGLSVMTYWTGTARSGELLLVLPAQPGGGKGGPGPEKGGAPPPAPEAGRGP